MSAANASAKKRRANMGSGITPPQPNNIDIQRQQLQLIQQQRKRDLLIQTQQQNQSSLQTSTMNVSQNEKSSTSTQNTSTNYSLTGLTLPQIVSLFDKRLKTLENFMDDTKTSKDITTSNSDIESSYVDTYEKNGHLDELNEYMEEMNSRFEILVKEISELKNIVFVLQSYTLNVNQVLMDEKIHQIKMNINCHDEYDNDDVNKIVIHNDDMTSENVSMTHPEIADLTSDIMDDFSEPTITTTTTMDAQPDTVDDYTEQTQAANESINTTPLDETSESTIITNNIQETDNNVENKPEYQNIQLEINEESTNSVTENTGEQPAIETETQTNMKRQRQKRSVKIDT